MKTNPRKRGKLTGAAKAAFLARMAKGRRKAGKKSPKAKRRAARSMRVVKYFITAKGRGPRMHFDGTRFSQRPGRVLYGTKEAARKAALGLLRKYPVLQKYSVAVESTF